MSMPRLRAGVLLTVAALVAKAVVLWQLHDHVLLQPSGVLDDAVYVQFARRIAAGDWAAGPDVYYLSPFYSYFLALILRVANDSLTAVRVVQITLGAIAVGLVHATAKRWFGTTAALVAGGLAVLTGLFSFYEILLLQTAVDPFLCAASLYALTRALAPDEAGGTSAGRTLLVWSVAAGVAFGLFAVHRPNVLAFVPVAALGLVMDRRWRPCWSRAVAFCLGVVLAIAPVTLRNKVVAGEWVLISWNGGINFYIGNNARADGTYTIVAGITPSIPGQVRDSRAMAEKGAGHPLSASEVSGYFYALARDWIQAHPWDAARLFARKVGYVFNTSDLALNYSYTYYANDEVSLLRLLCVGPWLLVPLGVLGLVVGAPVGRRVAYGTWAAFVPIFSVAIAVFFVSTRYRLPLLVPLCSASGAGAAWLVEAVRRRRAGAVTAAAATLLALGAFVTRDIGPDSGRMNERTEMIVHLVDRGEVARAEALLARTESSHPDPALLYFRVGRAYLDRGDTARAIALFEAALRSDTERLEVHAFLGHALVLAQRYAEALPYLKRAREAGIASDTVGFDLAKSLAELGRADEARAALARAVEASGGADGPSWLNLGLLALRLQRPAYAERLLRTAVAKSPGLAVAHENLGLALYLQGRADEAVPELERAVQLDPDSAKAHYNLALVLAQTGRIAEARQMAEAALRLRPSYPEARSILEQIATIR